MKVAFKAVLAGVFAVAMIAGCTDRGGSARGPASTDQQDSSGAAAMGTPSSSKDSSKSGGGM